MGIERLDTDIRLPFDEEALRSGNPARMARALFEILKVLQPLLQRISEVANLSIDQADGDAIYSKLKQADGTYPLGTWRLIQIDDSWVRQVQLTLGTWTEAGKFEVPE